MVEKRSWGSRLTAGADLPAESVPGQPVVELIGNDRVIIEEHRGVSEYSGQQITVNMCYGKISIRGCNLELSKMMGHQMVITGRIEGLESQLGGKHGNCKVAGRHGRG